MNVSRVFNLLKYDKSKNVFCSGVSIFKRSEIIRLESVKANGIGEYDFPEIKINNITLNLKSYIGKIKEHYEKPTHNKDNKFNHILPKLEPIIGFLNQRKEIIDNLISLKEFENERDEVLQKLAKSDIDDYKEALKEVEENLFSALMPTFDEDSCNAIVLEVNAGVGGQEAMLFAKELYDMYSNFAVYKGWQVEVAELAETDIGGIRHGTLLIAGDSVFRMYKYEAGVHRVQRIPSTEKGGRIHTSTVSVLALPQPTEIQINLQHKDLKVETKRASGAGGQHVNTTDSAVRITHIPSGVSVECQVDRSQIKNKRIAITKLRTLLYQRELNSKMVEIDATRKSQVRSNFRNEKIRTYNFSQDRVTDHRVQGNTHNLKGFLEGSSALEELITRLDKNDRLEKLLETINKANLS